MKHVRKFAQILFAWAGITAVLTFFKAIELNLTPEASSILAKIHGAITEKKSIEFQNIKECNCTRKLLWPRKSFLSLVKYNSSCSDEGTFYQANQNVVTFSLHFPSENDNRRKQLYKDGIQMNLERLRQNYPGYSMRMYTDVNLEGDYCKFICENSDLFWCDIRKTPPFGDQSNMFFATWRFLTMGDPTVEIFLSRDLDSVITPREAAVVQDWLQLPEKKAIHLMRDAGKSHDIPILAGLWGAVNSQLQNASKIRDDIIDKSRALKKYKTLDQTILNEVIFYQRNNSIVAYDSYTCERWKQFTMVKPFPVRRINTFSDFVGTVNLGRVGKKRKNLPKCPVECRPSYGKDWEYC